MIWLLWYCFDDHLAAALGTPGLGHLPWWVVALIQFALSSNTALATSYDPRR